ncbi:MAG: cadherin-like beta sandwich domain-containing protein [Treponema sp.]|nr:cadherin-like beta sandwich domain-containing protein [Treponema sp.]
MYLSIRKSALIVFIIVLFTGALFVSCEQPAGIELSDDATLKLLNISAGTLNPSFNAAHFDYTVSVRNSVNEVTVTALANNSAAAVAGTGVKELNIGGNLIKINVKAEDGSGKTYAIIVTRNNGFIKEIDTAQDMAKIGVEEGWSLAGEYILEENITLENWTPADEPFSGVFDGNGKTITLKGTSGFAGNSSIIANDNNPAGSDNAFFGIFSSIKGDFVSVKAEVKNLKIHADNLTVSATEGASIGMLAGYAQTAIIDNITLSGSLKVESTKTVYAGGVAGVVMGDGPAAWVSGSNYLTNSGSVPVETFIKNVNSSMSIDVTPGSGSALVTQNANAFSFIGGIAGFFKKAVGIENCRNTASVKGVSTTSGSQVMVGGILGGSFYQFTDHFSGYIRDCSSTGNITVGAMGFWPMAGGIVGLYCGGDGTKENSTRIEKCYATGKITHELTTDPTNANQWPYIGGLVGYAYNGCWVSQSYFNGEVFCGKRNDYTGGIAGYSSYATNGSNTKVCVIEDCWSDGKVTGYNNAGGIVGQNQQYTLLRRSYSRMEVAVTNGETNTAAQWGIGGITGSHSSTVPEAMDSCVALNRSIKAPGKTTLEIGRIAGRMQKAGEVSPILKNVYALPALKPVITGEYDYIERKGADQPDGADIPNEYLSGSMPTQSFYQTLLGWDFSGVWMMGADGYPKLRWSQQ